MNNEKLYIFDRLNTGKNLDIIFMSDNTYWPNVNMLGEQYSNCKVEVLGKGTAYMELAQYCTKLYGPIDKCDLIILYEKDFYEREYVKMKAFAHEVSKKENKPVTIGYAYLNPDHKNNDLNKEYTISLVNINNDDEFEDTITVLNLEPLELVNCVLTKHDNLNSSKVKTLKNF